MVWMAPSLGGGLLMALSRLGAWSILWVHGQPAPGRAGCLGTPTLVPPEGLWQSSRQPWFGVAFKSD